LKGFTKLTAPRKEKASSVSALRFPSMLATLLMISFGKARQLSIAWRTRPQDAGRESLSWRDRIWRPNVPEFSRLAQPIGGQRSQSCEPRGWALKLTVSHRRMQTVNNMM
jgi:hypothetical protein